MADPISYRPKRPASKMLVGARLIHAPEVEIEDAFKLARRRENALEQGTRVRNVLAARGRLGFLHGPAMIPASTANKQS
jgi:hypothetical protein